MIQKTKKNTITNLPNITLKAVKIHNLSIQQTT